MSPEKNITKEIKKSRFGNNDDSRDITQYLFRMEFLVHSIGGVRLERLNQIVKEPTSVIFKFLGFNDDKIEVTQVDRMFNPIQSFLDVEENFSSGCSVLFAISTYFLTKKLVEFIVDVTVLKKKPPEADSEIIVGKGVLDLTKQFLAIRKEFMVFENFEDIPSKSFEGKVPLVYEDVLVGNVDLEVRMSTCGQCVVTEIEDTSDKSGIFAFKPVFDLGVSRNEISYQCRIVEEEKIPFSQAHVSGVFKCPSNGLESEGKKVISRNEELGMIQSSRGPKGWRGKPVIISVSETFGEEKAAFSVGTKPEPAGPQQDVFILRFGKKGIVADGEKSNIEIHLKTPRGVDKRLPVRWETREVQTEENKGKEKGGKVKKKKKRKK